MGRVGLPFSQLGLSDIYQCGYEGRNKNQLITWNDKTLAGNQLCLLKVQPRELHSAAQKRQGHFWSPVVKEIIGEASSEQSRYKRDSCLRFYGENDLSAKAPPSSWRGNGRLLSPSAGVGEPTEPSRKRFPLSTDLGSS